MSGFKKWAAVLRLVVGEEVVRFKGNAGHACANACHVPAASKAVWGPVRIPAFHELQCHSSLGCMCVREIRERGIGWHTVDLTREWTWSIIELLGRRSSTLEKIVHQVDGEDRDALEPRRADEESAATVRTNIGKVKTRHPRARRLSTKYYSAQ